MLARLNDRDSFYNIHDHQSIKVMAVPGQLLIPLKNEVKQKDAQHIKQKVQYVWSCQGGKTV